MSLSDTLGADRLAGQYFLTRLEATRRAQQLSASEQFDLARSPLSDDELEDIVDQFRDTPSPRSGWGLADGLNELMSREPKRVPITDMQALQRNLVAQGYAPPDADPNGTWDPSWYASFRRWDRDNFDKQREGRHWYSAPVTSGINALTNTLPSRVFQGIVGAAKGVVLQAPETLERGGLVGGAVEGGAIGAAVGSVIPGVGTAVGAGVGAVIGGASGFLLDLFGDSEGEPEDQSGLANFVDALTPWTEYNQNPKDIFKDLGYVLTTASMATGVGTAAKASVTGIRALQAARALPEAGAVLGEAGAVEQVAPLAKAALFRPPANNQLGVFGSIVRAATKKLAPGTVGALEQSMLKYSPIAFGQRLGPNIALKAFGGVSQAQMGARLFGGIGQGSRERFEEAKTALEAELGRDLNENEVRQIEKQTAQTQIEKQIASTSELRTGVELPFLGDLVDVAAFVLYPQRLLPFGGTEIGRSAVSIMGDTTLAPFAHAVMDRNPELSISKAVSQIKGWLTPTDNAWLRADYGINREAHSIVNAARLSPEKAFRTNALTNARADVIRAIRKEYDAVGKSDTLERVMRYSMDTVDGLDGPTDFTAWLTGLNGKHRGLDKLAAWKDANALSRRVERDLAEGRITANPTLIDDEIMTISPTSGRGMGDTHPTRGKAPSGTTIRPEQNMDLIVLKDRIRHNEELAKRFERIARTGATDPYTSIAARERARLARAEADTLKKNLRALEAKSAVPRTAETERFTVTPAREDFADRKTILAKRDEFLALRTDVLRAVEETNPAAEAIARQKLANFVDDLSAAGFVPDELARKAKTGKPSDRIAKVLEVQSRSAAKTIDLPPEMAARFSELGYKPVATGDDVLFPDQLEQMIEITGIGDYTRRAQVWETLGLSPKWRTDRALFRLRREHEISELEQVFAENGIKLNGEQALRRLHERLREFNHDAAVLGPVSIAREGAQRKRFSLYKVDTRDLSPADIFTAFEDVPGVTDEVAHRIYGALRRGAAYGGELRMMHPVESAKALGTAMRLNGLPGFSDLVRTWHSEVPTKLSRGALRREEFHYKPSASADAALDLAHSAERTRVEVALKDVAANSRVTEGQRQFGMMMLDSMARSQVRSGRFSSVDDFFAHLDAGYAAKYVADEGDLLKVTARLGPDTVEVDQLGKIRPDEVEVGTKVVGDPSFRYEEGRPIGRVESVRLEDLEPTQGFTEARQVEEYSKVAAEERPYIVVERHPDGSLKIRDGHHRYIAAQNRGEQRVNAVVFDTDATGRPMRFLAEPARPTVSQPLFKKIAPAPSREVLQEMARSFDGSRTWYEDSAQTLAAEFGHLGKVTMRNGTEQDGLDVVTQLIAVTSPRKDPKQNFATALDILNDHLAGRPVRGVVPSVKGLVERVLSGEHISTWTKGSPKVRNFYANLSGDLNKVTADSWMARLFGYTDSITPKEFEAISAAVTDVSKDLGWFPAQTQAALWAAVKDGAAREVEGEIIRLSEAGLTAEANQLRRQVGRLREAGSYADVAKDPAIAARIDRLVADGGGLHYLKEVQDEVLGMTKFGDEFRTVLRFFKNADFETLVHENAHMLRRLVSPEDARVIEAAYGVPALEDVAQTFTPTPLTHAKGSLFAKAAEEIRLKTIDLESVGGGGATWDPHTGRFVEGGKPGAGAAVAVNEGTSRVVDAARAAEDPAYFQRELNAFIKENKQALENPDVFVGTWNDREGAIHLDVSEVLQDKRRAQMLGELRKQKKVFDLEKLEDIDTIPRWTREAEERFARDAEKFFLKRVKPGQAEGAFDVLRHSVGNLWGSTRPYWSETGAVPRSVRRFFDQQFEDVLKVLPDSRARAALRTTTSKQVVGGAVAGGVLGATEGDSPDDILRGVALGSAAGLGARTALRRTYGYLPDYLARANAALRYTLSLTFDAGRYTEQNMIAMTKHGLPPMLAPKKYMRAREWRSPYTNGTVTGENAWKDAVRFFDEMNGTNGLFQNIDDIDRRMFQSGLLGFAPRNWEVAQAFQLYQRGMPAESIRQAVAEIGRYGIGRTAAEKSANFVVFPFSFSKKLITTLGDFFLQAPARNLLLHEGMRRFHESEFDDKVQDFIDRRLPMLNELKMINNLAFGISPGRFFLQGLGDRRTGFGQAAQLLAGAFIPSGAATALQEAFGSAGDLAIHAFSPVVVTGESITRSGGMDPVTEIFRRYIPFIRELDQYFLGENNALRQQIVALKEGAEPYYQFQKYQEELKESKSGYDGLAVALGYQGVDGLLQSDAGMGIQAELERKQQELAEKYPTGWQMSQSFTNSDALDERALLDLSEKVATGHASVSEERILQLAEDERRIDTLSQYLNLPPDVLAAMAAKQIRGKAMSWIDDARFAELYDRFFLRTYGPIRRVA